MTSRKTSLLCAVACLVVPAAAFAGTKENKERAAKTACLSGDYAKGVALLAELYVSTNEILYLFNQGRCFEQNGKYAEAIVRFREYQQKNADAGNAPDAQAEAHIAKCEGLLGKQSPEQAAPSTRPAEKPAVVDKAEPKTVEAQPEVQMGPKVEVAESTAPVVPGRGLRVAGIAAVSAGVAGIATGVILNLKANGMAKDLNAADGSPSILYSRGKESSRSTYETWGWVAYGAGAACLAGGALLYWLGHSQGHNAQFALVPTFGSANVGAALQGAF